MASREEEKRRRREEREAAAAAEAKAAGRTKRLQIGLAALLGVAVIAGGVFAITQSGGDGGAATEPSEEPLARIPDQRETDMKAAAMKAGCRLQTFESEGRDHVEDTVTYKTNPPTSGPHDPVPAEDGFYPAGNEPAKEPLVHSLEHGRVLIQYKPGTPRPVIDQLETVGSEEFEGEPGYHVLVLQNNTKMEPAVAATAWTQSLTCPRMNDRVFDAIRTFRVQYTDKAPEFIP